ncbi:hypothetical protein TanjilG_06229 [Lupinus angustifolius]|uniref:UDP-glucuronate decarboxylase n=1 Tax=Lupinus angustifolius TaxID=3871 RepID=A0A1J7HTL1_LUPAN|nr:hypothetical protein TanjilG_06229 [Lupinus angustifolius]
MKQLHKQTSLSHRRDEEMITSSSTSTPPYSPKAPKHNNNNNHHRTLPRSINYLLREQRLLFILLGILIGSTFFIIQPTLSRLSTTEPQPFLYTGSNRYVHGVVLRGRVPVGITSRRLRVVTNVMGTLNMLGLAKRVGARFLITSTSEVYGDPLEHPQKETYWGNVNPIGERSCYDEGKRTAETLTMDYHRGAGVEVRIARIFNTYGPRMCLDDGRVVSNFVAQAIRKQPMTVYGDGKQTRSFQYVSDLVNGLTALMDGEHIGPFNLGNPGEFTMLELAQVVKETIDSSATIEYKPNTADDPHMRKPDISKAKELLNWEPKIPLREGLPLMVNDFRNRILNEDEGKGMK